MKTSIIGYPRIGKDRELKFALEKFFRGELGESDIEGVASDIRNKNLMTQKEEGIDYISCNDFSYYDNMLDTAILLNIIPARYTNLNLTPLETYFAMARGYQGDKGNVKALAMKKWFNTNYHYIVPEIDDECVIKLNANKPIKELREAKALGIDAKVDLIGPFTLLKLAKYTGSKKAQDFAEDIKGAYIELMDKLTSEGASWIQFDEPILVMDLSADDKQLFMDIYEAILARKGSIKILLTTYFGDIRDVYVEVCKMDFDGIGLDFIEGKKTVSLIKDKGFPADKILFAGLINGKNIWKNNYKKTLDVLAKLKSEAINVVLSTSCSLLHVPYTLQSETKLAGDYLKHFAFAKEKLVELRELSELFDYDIENVSSNPIFTSNAKLFEMRINSTNQAVQDRVGSISESDYTRLPKFEEREKIQKEALNLPMYPTTTIGSFPQTSDVRRERKRFKAGEISLEEYTRFNEGKIADCIKLQEEIGLDVLVHGEYERNDMVEYFGENLDGFLFTDKAWVQSYGTRCVKPPIIWGDVSRKNPITVSWSKYAKSCTGKLVKGMLTGPVTILNWSFPREDISIKESTLQIALAIRDEVLDLEEAGINIIQIDEAALREKLPLRKSDWYEDYLDWAIPAFRLVHSGVKPETQIHTHMCYSEFTDIIKAIDEMDADVITFEASRSDLMILDSLNENNFKTQVGPGVYDIHSPRVPSVDEIVDALNAMRDKVAKDKLWVNPDCGLKTRGEEETKASLINLVEAARIIRES